MCAYVRMCVCSGDDVYKCAGGLDVHVRCLSIDVSAHVYMQMWVCLHVER